MASGKVAYRVAVSKSDEVVEGLRVIRSTRCHGKGAYGEKKGLHLGSPFCGRLYKLWLRDGRKTTQLLKRSSRNGCF